MENNHSKLTQQLHDYFSANQFDKCAELAAPDVRVTAHAFGMSFHGQEEFRNFMMGFKQAFPDMVLHHDSLVSNGNKVAVEFTATGTHTGPLQTPAGPIPASGKKVALKVAEFYEWENGKFKEMANYQDAGTLMRQIGAM
ncbi:MAG: ester cyclase [Saprospiraceae bacterium]|nr:ester cyclase [Saprospiraceae bacterium]